jgi:hypothetical protein
MKKQFLFAMLLATTTFAFTSGLPSADPVDEEDHQEDGCGIYKNMNLQDIARSLTGDFSRDVSQKDLKQLILNILAERSELQASGAQLTLRLEQQALDFQEALARKEQESFDAIEALMTKHKNDKAALQAQLQLAARGVDQVAARGGNLNPKFGLPGAWMKK